MAKHTFTERVQSAFAGVRVTGTPEAPVVEGVLLCGPVSANRRRYLKDAFAGDRVTRYNGCPVKVTSRHGDVNGLYAEEIGTIQNARHRPSDGMPVGDIAVNPATELARKFVWDAQHQPKACGMSHVADCDTRKGADGWDEVVEMVECHSVDVIGARRAATTKGLAEGKSVDTISLKQFVETYGPTYGPARWSALSKLCEDLGAPADAPVVAAPDSTAEPDLKSALMNVLWPMVEGAFDTGDEADENRTKKALSDFIRLHSKHNGKEPAPPAEPEKESRPSASAVQKECTDAGFAATVEQITSLADIPVRETRLAQIGLLKKASEGAGRERPVSRPRAVMPLPRPQFQSTPEKPKDFASRYRA